MFYLSDKSELVRDELQRDPGILMKLHLLMASKLNITLRGVFGNNHIFSIFITQAFN